MWMQVYKWFFSVRLLHVEHKFTGDIIEKYLLPIFMWGVLTVTETQLGKAIKTWLGKGRLPAVIYAS